MQLIRVAQLFHFFVRNYVVIFHNYFAIRIRKHVTFISPSTEKIDALLEIEEPTSKKELQIFCGLVSSLQAWYQATGLLIPGLRKMTAHNTPFVWNADLTEEFKNIKEYFKNGIKLSPMDPN